MAVGLLALSATAPLAAQPSEGSARDMFRKSACRFGRCPEPAVKKTPTAPVKTATTRPTPPAPKTPKPEPATTAAVDVAIAQPKPPKQDSPKQPAPEPRRTEDPQATLASTAPMQSEPLGLRYSIVKQVGKETREVDSDTVFRSGDRIKLQVQASDKAYLYLVLKGSSGRWKVLFPTPEIADGDNRIQPDTTYMVPSNERAWFSFDEQVGSEQLFILLSRKPQQDLESMIYDLRKGGQPAGAQPPAGPPSDPDDGTRVMLASDQREVDDVVIAGIRQKVYSRDLVFEKVEEDEQEPEWTKAVYVVDKDGSPDSRIVADVKLEHR